MSDLQKSYLPLQVRSSTYNVRPLYAEPGLDSDLHRSYLPSQVSCTYVWPFNVKPGLNSNLGVPLYLSGFVCAYHLASPGSSPKHTIYTFYGQILYCICHRVEKRTKITKKRPGLAQLLFKQKHFVKEAQRVVWLTRWKTFYAFRDNTTTSDWAK